MLEVVVVEWDKIEAEIARSWFETMSQPQCTPLELNYEAPECQGSFPSLARHSPLHQIPPGLGGLSETDCEKNHFSIWDRSTCIG